MMLLFVFFLCRRTNLSWALYSLGVMEFISVPAIHRPCLKKVRCSWVVFFFLVLVAFILLLNMREKFLHSHSVPSP